MFAGNGGGGWRGRCTLGEAELLDPPPWLTRIPAAASAPPLPLSSVPPLPPLPSAPLPGKMAVPAHNTGMKLFFFLSLHFLDLHTMHLCGLTRLLFCLLPMCRRFPF